MLSMDSEVCFPRGGAGEGGGERRGIGGRNAWAQGSGGKVYACAGGGGLVYLRMTWAKFDLSNKTYSITRTSDTSV